MEGTEENPVVFSTVNDKKYNPTAGDLPNPFDWNGIIITSKAGSVRLRNSIVAYTVYGIKAMKKDFSIYNGIFYENGQFYLTVNKTIMHVSDNKI